MAPPKRGPKVPRPWRGSGSVAKHLRDETGRELDHQVFIAVLVRAHPAITRRRRGQAIGAVIADHVARLQVHHRHALSAAPLLLVPTQVTAIVVATVVAAVMAIVVLPRRG